MPTTPEYDQWLADQVITRYGFDKTATHSDNLVPNEVHVLIKDDGTYIKAIAPREGAFYTADVVVRDITDAANPVVLTKATRDPNNDGELITTNTYDYVCVEPSMNVGSITGKEACYIIVFPGDNNPPEKVDVTYQVVGGQFIHDTRTIIQLYENLADGYVDWDDIVNKPSLFVGHHHGHSIDDTYGWEYIVEALDRLGRTMELGHIPSYVEMTKKICEVGAKASRPRIKVNHKNLFDGLPYDGYMTKNDVMAIIFRLENRPYEKEKFSDKTFEASYDKITGKYTHAVMTSLVDKSHWTIGQLFSLEYVVLDKDTGVKRLVTDTKEAGLLSVPILGGPARVGLPSEQIIDVTKNEVVVSIAIYHQSLPGVNLSLHYDSNEVVTHNHKYLPDQDKNVLSYHYQDDIDG